MRLAAIVFLAALVLTACGISSDKTAPAPSTSTPADTARTYFTGLKQGDCQTVSSLLSTDYKARLGGESAVSQWCTIALQHAEIVPANDITVLNPQLAGEDRATVTVTFTNPGSSVQQEVVETVREGNSWKIQDLRPTGQQPSPSP